MNANDVWDLILMLKELRQLGDIPKEHHLSRRMTEYSNFIPKSKELSVPPFEDDSEKPSRKLSNIEDYVWIPEGNVNVTEFLEVDTEKIKSGVKVEGTDSLAWYRSFHWNPPKDWGIYIVDRSLYYLAREVFQGLNLVTPDGRQYNTLDLLQLSFRLLFLHEFFHFLTDIAATTLEIAAITHWSRFGHYYLYYFPRYYLHYVADVYMRPGPHEPIEESLANAYAYHRFGDRRIRKALRAFMENQPNGYRDFNLYLGKNFAAGRRQLACLIAGGRHRLRPLPPIEILLDCRGQDVPFWVVPVYIVPTISDARYQVGFVKSISGRQIRETAKFQRELEALPDEIKEKYQKAMSMLQQQIHHPGLRFERRKGWDTVFTIRIDRKYRLSMRPVDEGWEFLRIGPHEEIDRNPM